MGQLPYSETPPSNRPDHPVILPSASLTDAGNPAGYLPDGGLVDAVNVALILHQPLLVTGEPGTGKSQLAASVAYQLGLELPLAFETKSTTSSRDLFYSFDNIERFRAAQTSVGSSDPRNFLKLNALGLAIALANDRDEVAHLLPPEFVHTGRRRSVVLIDEIDKAPRDFPNDILNEIERFYFRIPELGNATIKAETEFRPIVIMTSNSEKSLPDPFLRRCIYYSIPFPDDDRLERIVLSRLPERIQEGGPLLRDAVVFFSQLRQDELALRKKPGTAELLNWVAAMLDLGCESSQTVRSQAAIAQRTLSTLSKISEDQESVNETFKRWVYSG